MPSKTPIDPGTTASKTDWAALDAMTDDDVEAAASADPDAPPLGPGRTLHRMAAVKRVRLTLGLSPAEFAGRFRIPMPTLMAWERHEAEPDAVAVSYIAAIEGDAEGVARALVRPTPPSREGMPAG
jgi:putative transcriptional regulator